MTTSPSITAASGALLLLGLSLGACSAIGEAAYDSAAQFERQRCDRLASTPERQACLDKVRSAARQAETVRSKP